MRSRLLPALRAARPTLLNGRSLSTTVLHTPIETSAAEVHPPFARYVHACSVPPEARVIVTSGQLGIGTDGSIPTGAEAQTALAFRNVASILASAGAGMEHVVRLNAYVTGREHLPGYMKARDEALGDLPPTASTLMIVSGFARPEFVVEVEALAAVPAAPAAPRSTPGSIAAAAAGRRALHTSAHGRHRLRLSAAHGQPPHRRLHGERVAPAAVAAFVEEVRAAGVQVMAAADGEAARKECARKSRDFFWYSPILKQTLGGATGRGRVADALVLARSEADVIAACGAAARHRVPLTTRGAGTGNYGQAMPLRGGAVLDVSGLDAIEPVDAVAGTVRAGAGARLEDIEEAARAHGWELRQHPSTRRIATIGGFVGGGSTGHGALLHGGLSEDGAVLGLRVVTAGDGGGGGGAPPRVLELRGRDVFPVVHAYGTNGVITQVEMPLARAQPWTDVTLAFASFSDAAACALEVANAPAVVKRAVTVLQAPIPHRYLDAETLLHDPAGVAWRDAALAAADGGEACHVCMVQCAAPSVGPVERLAAERNGQVTRAVAAASAPRPFFEFGWNHTTLHALRHDKAATYLQAVMEPERALELVDKVSAEFATSELMQHLEVVNFNGRAGFASLALLWPDGGAAAGAAGAAGGACSSSSLS